MAYLGNAPSRSFISFERQVFTIVNSQTAYTLDHSVNNENDIRLVINNIVQEPGSGKAYTASGTTLTLSAALVNGTDEMYCVFLGRATATNAPGAGSVGTSQLASDAVTEAKIADDAVTYAKIQNVSTNDRILGRVSSGAGEIQEIHCTAFARDILNDADAAAVRTTIGAVEQSDINAAIANLVDSSPAALDTLNELAAAIGDDANFSTTVTNSIATKMPLTGGTFTGDVSFSRDATNRRKIDFGAIGAGFSANATDLDYIRLYTSGSNYAGFGITTSNMNIGTTGPINVSIYAAGVLNERKTGTLTRHYVDQFFNGKLYTSGGSASLPIISREGDSNTGIYYPAADELAIAIGGSEQVHVTSTALEVNAGAVYSPLYRANNDGLVTATAYGRSGDPDTGFYFPAADKLGLVAGGVEFLRGATTSGTTVVSCSHLIDTTNFIYANGYRAKNAGSASSTAYGRHSDGDTGMYFPAADQVGISSGGNDRVNFNANASTFYRTAGQPTIKADTGNSGYMIVDSAGGHLSLNHYVGDDVFLCYALGGSGDVIIGASTTNGYNPNSRKLLVEGDTETKGVTYSDRYIADTNGSATDPAFEIDGTIDGTGWYTPSSMVNGGNSAGYGFAIAAAHNHVAEFGYKSHIGNGRPTIYGGAQAALLELNGNSRRGSLFGYNIYSTSSSLANNAIGGEFYCTASGGTSANDVKGFKSYLNSTGANGTEAAAGLFHTNLASATGTWTNCYGVRIDLDIPSSTSGTVTTVAALYIDALAASSNATYGTSPDGIENRYAIFQDGDADYNRFDGRTYFRNRMYLTNSSRFEVATGSDIRLPNGSASDPAIRFSSDLDTGIKRNSNGNFDIVTAGAERLSITTAGDIHTASGRTVYLNGSISDGTTTKTTTQVLEVVAAGVPPSSYGQNLLFG